MQSNNKQQIHSHSQHPSSSSSSSTTSNTNINNKKINKIPPKKSSIYKKLKMEKINPNRYQIPNHPHSPTNRRKMNQARPEKVELRGPKTLKPFDNEKVLQNLV